MCLLSVSLPTAQCHNVTPSIPPIYKSLPSFLDKGLESRRQSLRYFGAKPCGLAIINSPLVVKEALGNTLMVRKSGYYVLPCNHLVDEF